MLRTTRSKKAGRIRSYKVLCKTEKIKKHLLVIISIKKQDQISQLELELIFNEAEALTGTLYMVEPVEEDVIQPSCRKSKGKREADLKNLPVKVFSHTPP